VLIYDFSINYRKTAGKVKGASAFCWQTTQKRQCSKYNQLD